LLGEELLDVAHHPERELGREDAGVLRLVLLRMSACTVPAHLSERLGADARIGLRIEQLVARTAEQP